MDTNVYNLGAQKHIGFSTQNLDSVSTRQQIVARIMELTRHIQMFQTLSTAGCL
jgi:hypothetical protein